MRGYAAIEGDEALDFYDFMEAMTRNIPNTPEDATKVCAVCAAVRRGRLAAARSSAPPPDLLFCTCAKMRVDMTLRSPPVPRIPTQVH